jgi:hypothetical protein
VLGERLHVWPFDGWSIPAGKSALVEVRSAIWRELEPIAALTAGQKDAFFTASWLKRADESEELAAALQPQLSPPDKLLSAVEGWILGCEASARIGGSRVAKAEGWRPHLI